jgi:hypothetical protein
MLCGADSMLTHGILGMCDLFCSFWPPAFFLASAQSLTIGNVNVVDVETGTVRRSFVRITNGVDLGIAPAGPQGTVNGTGKYLIPGLWDMHVHLWEKRPMLGFYVAHGVVGVRDMGSDFQRVRMRGARTWKAAAR